MFSHMYTILCIIYDYNIYTCMLICMYVCMHIQFEVNLYTQVYNTVTLSHCHAFVECILPIMKARYRYVRRIRV